MRNTNITQARNNLFKLADSCIEYNEIININTKNGNVIMLSEEEYNGLIETLYLQNIPGLVESVKEGLDTPSEDLEEFKWDDV